MSSVVHDKLKEMMLDAKYITDEQALEEGWSTLHHAAWSSYAYHVLGLASADLPNEVQLDIILEQEAAKAKKNEEAAVEAEADVSSDTNSSSNTETSVTEETSEEETSEEETSEDDDTTE